jgi:RNA polymerase sigma-70 factor (ECF subfamily)
MTEKEAIKGCLSLNEKAQRFLYDLYKAKWYSYCIRYLIQHADAEDAFQNSLIKIFSNIQSYKDEIGDFGAWSAKIVINECIMLLRQKKRLNFNYEVKDDLLLYADNENPIDTLSKNELIKMINKLPDGYRIIFNMYVLEGYTHKEIAEKLNITEGTSKSQLFKAKKMLKESLELIF